MRHARSGGSVAAGHDATATAAAAVLSAGGSAFDAVIAAIATACVAEPVLASLGGGGYLLAQPADERARVYDFFVHTPGRRLADDEHDFRPVLADFGTVTQEFHIGAGAVAVPGVVRGLFEVHRDLGRVPIRELLQPAVTAARDGVVMRPYDARVLAIVSAIFSATPACHDAYASPADPRQLAQSGDRLRLPALADALEAIAAEGDALFYRGEIAALIAAQMEGGGHLTRADLERYEVRRSTALGTRYRDARIATNPPPASGGVLIAFALSLLAELELARLTPAGNDHLTALLNAMSLTSEARAAREIGAGKPLDETVLQPDFARLYRQRIAHHPRARSATTHISIADARGNVAAATLSNGESAALVVPGTGVLLNNMLGEEDLHPGGFNRWTPATRLTSMMAPTLVHRDDGTRYATGSGGSNRIRSAILQVLVNLLDFGLELEAATEAPRVHLEGERLSVEHGFDVEAIGGVLAAWPEHVLWRETSMFFGGVHSVRVQANGASAAAGDPRRGGVAVTV